MEKPFIEAQTHAQKPSGNSFHNRMLSVGMNQGVTPFFRNRVFKWCFQMVFPGSEGQSGSKMGVGRTKWLKTEGFAGIVFSIQQERSFSQAEVATLKSTVWKTPFGTPWPQRLATPNTIPEL